MRFAGRRVFCLIGASVVATAIGIADEKTDPRVGLKPGLKDAGVAALSMELVATLPKPPGFFDPKAPSGETTPSEEAESKAESKPAEPADAKPPAEQPAAGRGRGQRGGGGGLN